MTGMLLAAGLGTRLKPFTDHHPKALATVNGKTLLARNIAYLKRFGVNKLVINVHHFADQIEHVIQQNSWNGLEIFVSDERNEVLETGGGLLKARPFLEGDQPFVLMNVDILTDLNLQAMLQVHQQNKPLATLAVTTRKSSRQFLFNADGLLCGWRNEKTGEEKLCREVTPRFEKAFSGIHIIEPSIFGLIRQTGKFSIVDTYLQLAESQDIRCFDHTGDLLFDTGTAEKIQEAERFFPA